MNGNGKKKEWVETMNLNMRFALVQTALVIVRVKVSMKPFILASTQPTERIVRTLSVKQDF